MSHFSQFNLSEALLNSIKALGFENPTPVQKSTIPVVREGRDVISLAETGSGKTAAYLIPIIEKMTSDLGKRTLVLAPTRELAMQIAEVFRSMAERSLNLRSCVLIGGQPMMKQIKALKQNPKIIIATPGRLLDHVGQRTIDLRTVSCLVLDEADRMFDMGFAPQVNKVVQMLPRERQTLLFSATFPEEIRGLAKRILRNPVELEVRKTKKPPAVISQKVLEVTTAKKNDKLLDLINAATGSVMVFARTKHRTNRVSQYLADYGVKVTRLHGGRTQAQRTRSIADFKAGVFDVLVATDIAARGIDVPTVSDVINYDIPMTVDDYVHRVGRTGRAGQSGNAMTLVTPEDRKNWSYIAKRINSTVN